MGEIISQKLTQLRQLMKENQLDFYLVPSTDDHNDEYVPAGWQRRAFISGFTGSAGDALIGNQQAYLWTDARYFLQAEDQLDASSYELMRHQQGLTPSIDQWLSQNHSAAKIGVDPKVISIDTVQRWQKTLADSGCELVAVETNLIDATWRDRPDIKTHPISILPQKYAGMSCEQKIRQLRQQMQVDHHIISALDAIAWLFNIRGRDIEYNPLVISYAIVSQDHCQLFLDNTQLSQADMAYFQAQQVQIKPYQQFADELQDLNGRVLVDPKQSSWWVQQLCQQATLVLAQSPITLLKACKNDVEQKGLREAHRIDALALCQFFYWLEQNWQHTTELDAANKLDSLRRAHPECVDLSFNTISAYGDHGAIIHYSVDSKSNRAIKNDSLYLVDSGGQYYCGTTDVTRTIHLGEPSQQQKQHYTLVLKGHLALRHAHFPKGTCGENLDALARMPLWKHGLDYGHGTGHGVGCYLCVHEGPQRISQAASGVALQPGMAVSNEPGLYLQGQYGIRIENVCLVTQLENNSLTFTDLTLVPYDAKLIDTSLLSSEEINWINQYHQQIATRLSADLDDKVAKWLQQKTQPLSQ